MSGCIRRRFLGTEVGEAWDGADPECAESACSVIATAIVSRSSESLLFRMLKVQLPSVIAEVAAAVNARKTEPVA